MDTLLTEQARALLNEERRLLTRLRDLLQQTGADKATLEQLGGLIEGLDELFLLVVVGEFNAGKSSVLNALFGEKVMEEGPIPTTAKITLVRHGEEPLTRQLSEFMVERRHPAALLRNMHLVDTPGTNSIIRQHQKITEDFIPRSDLVLFVTSYDRPLTDSERQFLEFIREAWGRRLVVVLNKADLAKNEAALRQVIEHIESGCRELMGFEPKVFPVSAEQAFEAKTDDAAPDDLWEKSRFGALERFMTETLTGTEQLALKLTAPLDAAGRLLGRLEHRLGERRRILQDDEDTLKDLESQLGDTRARLQRSYQRPLSEVDNILLQMERRGVQFLDDTIRASFSKIQLLRDKDAFKEQFERQVLTDTERQIESRVTDAVDDLLNETTHLQSQMFRTFAERVRAAGRDDSLAAEQGFSYSRAEVFRATMQAADRQVERYSVEHEASRIVGNTHDAANTFLGMGAGAAGLGVAGLLLVLAPTLDMLGGFGVFSGVALAGLSATVLPRQRKKAIREFKEQITELRTAMKEALAEQLDREVETALGGVRETIQPYADFVERERGTLSEAAEEQEALANAMQHARAEVEEQVGTAQTGA